MRRGGVSFGLGLVALLFFLVSLGVGPVRLSPLVAAEALVGYGSDTARSIVGEIRLPRAILALAIGAMLGAAGAALQGLLRNPLASPSLFGAPQTAAFAAVTTVSLGVADVRSYALPVAAILGALASVFLLIAVAGRGASLLVLILAGLAISSLAGAATSLAMNLAPDPFAALEIAFWLLGSLDDRSFHHVAMALPFIALGMALLFTQRAAYRGAVARRGGRRESRHRGRARASRHRRRRRARRRRRRRRFRNDRLRGARRAPISCVLWSDTTRGACCCRARSRARPFCSPPTSASA